MHPFCGYQDYKGYAKKVMRAMVILIWEESTGYYNDVIMGAIASQITSLAIVFSTVCLDTDQRKHKSSASLAFVRGIHRRPVNSPHKWPVTRKMFPFDDIIMNWWYCHALYKIWKWLDNCNECYGQTGCREIWVYDEFQTFITFFCFLVLCFVVFVSWIPVDSRDTPGHIHQTLQWRHNECDGISNHQLHDC